METINKKETLLGMDVGSRRIGLSIADPSVRIAHPLTTLIVDGTEIVRLQTILLEHEVTKIIVGLPRNQGGDETEQSKAVRQFVKMQLAAFGLPIVFQDESLTSVLAEERLSRNKRGYRKEDIDREAATVILQDFLESPHG